jgi:CIC family chloride channel protein
MVLKLSFINSLVLVVFVVKRVLGGSIDKGTSQILYSVAKTSIVQKNKCMPNNYKFPVVGLGGSAGLESPIVVAGAAWIKLCAALQTELQTGPYSLVVESLPE